MAYSGRDPYETSKNEEILHSDYLAEFPFLLSDIQAAVGAKP